jgi:peptide-methionine (S)-S-oxide reductase
MVFCGLTNTDLITTTSKIGLGGGCHWCTEGVFSSLRGVALVNQGWIASVDENADFSEAVEVHFNSSLISLADLINIHLHTHASRSNHSMRGKYRSAVYVYDDIQFKLASDILTRLKSDFDTVIITQVYVFKSFKMNKRELQNYFYSAPDRPFCQMYIQPKIHLLLARFKHHVEQAKVNAIGIEIEGSPSQKHNDK